MESDGEAKVGEPSSYDWDDSELIKLYDEGMNNIKNKMRGNVKASSSSNFASGPSKGGRGGQGRQGALELRVGDFCQAVFSEDGVFYEAVIEAIHEDDTCTVKFVGYGNKETVPMSDLAPSRGPGIRHEQTEQAENTEKDWKVGDYCWAIYSEDNQWYEGKIIEIMEDDVVVVKFIGYGNEEEVPSCNLKPSHRRQSKSTQKCHRDSSVDNYSEENCSVSSQYSSMTESFSSRVSSGDHKRIVPRSQRAQLEVDETLLSPHAHNRRRASRRGPPGGLSNSYYTRRAPSLPPFPVDEDDDTLSSLLLSWYMAGYHTGYHMGVRSRSRH